MSKPQVTPAESESTEPGLANSDYKWVKPTAATINKHESLYEIAYAEAKQSLDSQQAELSKMRERAIGYMSFVGAATAFLAAADLAATGRHAAFYTLAISASAVSALALVLGAILLSPWFSRMWRVEPGTLVKTWIERDVPPPSRADMLRNLSLYYGRWYRKNAVTLRRVQRLYLAIVVTGGIQVILWAALAWNAK